MDAPPSPNDHAYEYGVVPPLTTLLKATVRGAVPEVGLAEPETES